VGEEHLSNPAFSITPLPRHHPSYPAPRVPHIPFIPRDHMDMCMKNRLPGCRMDVDANVEAIGLELLL
jgi:hypothetical protein